VWKNLRCDEEIAEYHRKLAVQRANGKKGGRPKKRKNQPQKNPRVSDGLATGNPPLSDGIANQNPTETQPVTINHKPVTRNQDNPQTPKGAYTQEFDDAWSVYLRKGNKKPAFAAWKVLSPEDREKALSAIPAYFDEKELRYRKDFERYLRDRVFEGVLDRAANKPKESSGWFQDSPPPMPAQSTQVTTSDGDILLDDIEAIPF
jgi:hypothetical protein